MKPSFPLALLALVALASASAPPAMARHQIGAHGAPGDAQTVALCPDGQELRGFRGRSGAWIDQIQILCATLAPNGRYTEPTPPPGPAGQRFGGNGGADQEEFCPATLRLDAFRAYFDTEHRRIARIIMWCGYDPAKVTNPLGNVEPTGYFGAQFNPEHFDWIGGYCEKEVLIGLVINYGKDVNGIGYVCDKPLVPQKAVKNDRSAPVSPAAPPPRPAASNPAGTAVGSAVAQGLAGGTANVTGGPQAPARSVATAAAIAPRQAIAGVWQSRTDAAANPHYKITLTAVNQGIGPTGIDNLPIQVTGNFVNTDGVAGLDGGLQGVIQPNSRQLFYNYVRKNGETGSGVFTLSADGKQIVGEGNTAAKQHFNWNGGRAP